MIGVLMMTRPDADTLETSACTQELSLVLWGKVATASRVCVWKKVMSLMKIGS